jgi:RimJ/RimL family protein N-acetyltransferase
MQVNRWALDHEPSFLEVSGGRARLEPLKAEHAAALSRWIAHTPEIWRYSFFELADNPEVMGRWIGAALEARELGTELPFVVKDRASGNEPVGSTRFLDIRPAHKAVEIGWTWYARPAQRTSINTECKLLLLTHAFEVMGAVRVQLKCDDRNEPSKAAMRRIGCTYEGTLRRHMILRDGFNRDTSFFSVIRDEWPAVKERLNRLLSERRD